MGTSFGRGGATTFQQDLQNADCIVVMGSNMATAGRRRTGAIVAGVLLLAGSLAERFAVLHAGKASAADPRYTSLPQRERAAQSGLPAVTR